MSFFNNLSGSSRNSTPDRCSANSSSSSDFYRAESPASSVSNGSTCSDSSMRSDNSSRPGLTGQDRLRNNQSSIFGSDFSQSRFSDRIPRARSKLNELPSFRESLRNYSPNARQSGEVILNELKEKMRRESDTFFNSNPNPAFAAFRPGGKTEQLKERLRGPEPGMDDMRNRGYSAFPRMPHWLAEDDPQMLDLASRMSHAPNWPLSMGRRGGPWRDRRNSGGSAMSATSEDDSSYDHPHNDKSSQGSGGSGGLDAAIGHEIPIMIEAEAPPSMMPPPQQPQQQQNAPQQPHPQTSGMSGPEPPCVGQVRKSPQYATRTSSATDDVSGAHREQQRATRCSSAPPSMIDQRGNGTGRQAPHANKGSGAPQTRSATVPINPHNNVAKPFVSAFKNNSPRSQDPIMEESMQQQQQRPNSRHSSPAPQQQQQQQYSGQNFQQLPAGNHHQQHASQNYPQQQDQNYQQHPQQQYYEQDPLYYGQQQWPNQGFFQQYPDYGGPWQQFYSNDPRMYEQERHYAPQQQQQQQPPLQHQRPSVVRTIPIYIEGQERPIVNENEASSLSSSPRAAPQLTRNQQQQPQRQQQQPQRQQPQHQPQPPPWQSQQPKPRPTFQPQFRQHFPQDRPAENAFQQFFN
ncbi:bromodomain-containing protein DDB_G0280777, partial [Hyalella azteca]|uniref:Bromodomain-containing protein DDB_G0280777 n=1 Tax=Hyalella azteca TaxID=294128 RepID=A0A979FJD4_HYAAZ